MLGTTDREDKVAEFVLMGPTEYEKYAHKVLSEESKK
jgi:hypothetical protein